MAAAAREAGAEIRTSPHVTRILVDDNRVTGSVCHGLGLIGVSGGGLRANRVLDTGYTNDPVAGIRTLGSVDILDNTVSGMRAGAGGLREAASSRSRMQTRLRTGG